ncbi:MAG TPA: hypothetical protein VFC97_06290 [Verrucomicrobiae bacterium]|nr:hypothetical protein [Verrucomicrobiae bacterium]
MSSPIRTPSLARLVAAGVIDAELAALAWLLLEDGIPVLVVGVDQVARDELLEALAAALAESRRPDPTAPVGEGRLVRVAGTLATSTPPGILRAALGRTTGRSGLAATIEGTDLAEALAVLRRQGLSEDEASFLGSVLVLGPTAEPDAVMSVRDQRVVAAHYLRPVARDAGGHVQRLGPAVLATWDADRGAYDHFEWGIYPELAARTGRRAGDLESAHRARAEELRSRASANPL